MIKIKDSIKPHDTICAVTIDTYIPISFRTRKTPLAGARYIRIGDFKSQLLEIQFPLNSSVLSGFSLVSARGSLNNKLKGESKSTDGLPIIEIPQDNIEKKSNVISRFDIIDTITLSCDNEQAEISIGAHEKFNVTMKYGRIHFLLCDEILVGIRITNLTDHEKKTLQHYINTRLEK